VPARGGRIDQLSRPRKFAEDIRRISARDPVILAIDDPLGDGVESTLRGLSEGGALNLKIGWMPILHGGLGALSTAREIAGGGTVIADLKIADVPHVSGALARTLLDAGADAVIMHGFLGSDVVSSVLEAAGDGGVLVVAETSNPGASLCYPGCSDAIAAMARELGADGIIAPATRPDRIESLRRAVGDEMVVISPGIGIQGGEAIRAVSAGADMIVVGRSIMRSGSPGVELGRIRKEALDGLSLRRPPGSR